MMGSKEFRTKNDQSDKNGFLELQMAKLLARKGIDEMDSGSISIY